MICNTCGNVRFISTTDLAATKRCKICNLNKYRQELIGYENNTYKVLDFDHVAVRNNRRLYYKCICKNCNKESIVRKDCILEATSGKCVKCCGNNKTPEESSLFNIYMGRYKQGANSRGFTWTLSKENFKQLVTSNCYYCGAEPIEVQSMKRYNKTNMPFKVNGIDRINPESNYTIDNTVPCCIECNRMKLNYSKEFFLNHIEKIHQFQKSATTIENTEKSGSE